MVESTRTSTAESMKRVSSAMTGISRNDQPALKEHCLRRGGRKCLFSGYPEISETLEDGYWTECAHIVPMRDQAEYEVRRLVNWHERDGRAEFEVMWTGQDGPYVTWKPH